MMTALRLLVVLSCAYISNAAITVLNKDFKTQEFYILADAAITGPLTSIACADCSDTATVNAETPAVTEVVPGVYTFNLVGLVPAEDAGKRITVTAGADSADVVYYGTNRRMDFSLPAANGPAAITGAWQLPYVDDAAAVPDKRYVSAIRTYTDATSGALTAVVVAYQSTDDAAYSKVDKFGDQTVDAVAGGVVTDFVNAQLRKVAIHYSATGVIGIQLFTSSAADAAATIYGDPGEQVTVVMEDEITSCFENFVARYTDNTNWFLFPSQYALYAPIMASYNVYTGNLFQVNYKVVNELSSITTFSIEKLFDNDTLNFPPSEFSYTFDNPSVASLSMVIGTVNSDYFSLNLDVYPEGTNNNFQYGRPVISQFSTIAYEDPRGITTTSTDTVENEILVNAIDTSTLTETDFVTFADTTVDTNTVLFPTAINFEPNKALKLVQGGSENVFGDPATTFTAANVDITDKRIVGLAFYVNDGTGLLEAAEFTLDDESGTPEIVLIPTAFVTTDLTPVPVNIANCSNCQLSSFYTHFATDLLVVRAVYRFVPAPYLVSVNIVENKASEIVIEWWQQANFDTVSAWYQQASIGGDVYLDATCDTSAETVGAFVTCILPHLSAQTEYNVKLSGAQTADNANGFLQDTGMSNELTIATTNGVVVDCSDGFMAVNVTYEAVPQSAQLSSKIGTTLCNPGATGCDVADPANFDTKPVQNQRPAAEYFISSFQEFAGYPIAIVLVQAAAAGPFVGMRIDYGFLDEPEIVVPLGAEITDLDLAAYPVDGTGVDTRVTVVDLDWLTVWKVGARFTDDYLDRIEFFLTNADGTDAGSTGCLGDAAADTTGQCSLESTYNGYLVSSFSGNYVVDGSGNRIIKVTPFFSLQVTPTMLLANRDAENCAMSKHSDPQFVEDSYWSFKIVVDSSLVCGTTQSVVHRPSFEIQDERFQVVYSQLLTRAEDNVAAGNVEKPGQAAISRAIFFQIVPKCSYKADSELLIQFETLEEAAISAAGYSSLKFELLMFTDINYETAYTDMPVNVLVGGDLFYAVRLISDQNGLSILARDCWVSTSNNPTAEHDGSTVFRYELEAETCPEEETWLRAEAARSDIFDPHTFQSFYMVNAPQAEIFIHCRIYACNAEEVAGICIPNDDCDGTAPEVARKRRDLDLLAEEGIVKREIVTSRQRIYLENPNAQQFVESAMMMNVLASMFLFIVITVFVAGLVVVRQKIRSTRMMAEKLVA